MKPVGADGADVSSCTVCVETLLMLPTLSSTSHLTVFTPSVVMLKLAVEPATSVPLVTTSLPLIVGALPSVVYTTRSTPAPESLPEIATATGDEVYQPALQAAELQVTELVGALASCCAVKLVPELESPALFCAVALPVCVPAELLKVYAPAVFDQPAPSAGYV